MSLRCPYCDIETERCIIYSTTKGITTRCNKPVICYDCFFGVFQDTNKPLENEHSYLLSDPGKTF